MECLHSRDHRYVKTRGGAFGRMREPASAAPMPAADVPVARQKNSTKTGLKSNNLVQVCPMVAAWAFTTV